MSVLHPVTGQLCMCAYASWGLSVALAQLHGVGLLLPSAPRMRLPWPSNV